MHSEREIVQIGLKIHKRLLDDIFDRAKASGQHLKPDASMMELQRRLAILVGSESIAVSGRMKEQGIRLWRDTHRHAVSCYYRNYYGLREGRPQTPPEEESEIILLKSRGSNNVQIAKHLGLTKDTVRKRLKAATRRIMKPPKPPEA